MSALPPKADMFSVEIDVCFVPEADIDPLSEGFKASTQFAERTTLRPASQCRSRRRRVPRALRSRSMVGMAGRYTGSYLDRSNGWRAVATLAEIGQASLVGRIPHNNYDFGSPGTAKLRRTVLWGLNRGRLTMVTVLPDVADFPASSIALATSFGTA